MTFETIDGFEVVARFGNVLSERLVEPSSFRTTMRTLGSLVRATATELLTDAERARSEVLAELVERAGQLGANAIVKVRFDVSERGDGSTLVRASGDAVCLSPSPVPARARVR